MVGCDLCNKWFHWSSGGTVLLCLYRPECDGWDGGSLNGPKVSFVNLLNLNLFTANLSWKVHIFMAHF